MRKQYAMEDEIDDFDDRQYTSEQELSAPQDTDSVQQNLNASSMPLKEDEDSEKDYEKELIKLVNAELEDIDDELLKKRIDNPPGTPGSTRTRFMIHIALYILGLEEEKLHESKEKYKSLFQLAALGEIDMTIMYHENHIRDQKYGVKKDNIESVWEKKFQKQRLKYKRDNFINQKFAEDDQYYISIANKFMHEVHDLIGMFLDKKLTTIEKLKENTFPSEKINEMVSGLESFSNFNRVYEKDKFKTKAVNSTRILNFELESALESLKVRSRKNCHIYYLIGGKREGYRELENRDFDGYREYLKLYFARCFLLNIIFFYSNAKLLVKFFGDSQKEYNDIVQFAIYFGLMQQVVNDVSDYVPVWKNFVTATKFAEDTFSDMREHNITLPIIYYLATLEEKNENSAADMLVKQYQGQYALEWLMDGANQKKILNLLIENNALRYSMSFSALISRLAESKLEPDNRATEYLKNLLKSSDGNRYYQYYLSLY